MTDFYSVTTKRRLDHSTVEACRRARLYGVALAAADAFFSTEGPWIELQLHIDTIPNWSVRAAWDPIFLARLLDNGVTESLMRTKADARPFPRNDTPIQRHYGGDDVLYGQYLTCTAEAPSIVLVAEVDFHPGPFLSDGGDADEACTVVLFVHERWIPNLKRSLRYSSWAWQGDDRYAYAMDRVTKRPRRAHVHFARFTPAPNRDSPPSAASVELADGTILQCVPDPWWHPLKRVAAVAPGRDRADPWMPFLDIDGSGIQCGAATDRGAVLAMRSGNIVELRVGEPPRVLVPEPALPGSVDAVMADAGLQVRVGDAWFALDEAHLQTLRSSTADNAELMGDVAPWRWPVLDHPSPDLSGATVVLIGRLVVKKSLAKARLAALGAKVSGKVTKKTTHVIAPWQRDYVVQFKVDQAVGAGLTLLDQRVLLEPPPLNAVARGQG